MTPLMNVSKAPTVTLDKGRYLRLLMFFGGVMLNIVSWEVVLRRLFGDRAATRRRTSRLRNYARGFRRLAIRMGGVTIKLGQFLSARVDVMPPAITDELADLQDEVPAEEFSRMQHIFVAELGQPPEQIFAEFDMQTWAAASLGQVYRARLMTGEPVMVKIQRPNIEQVVATDLAALSQVARWTMLWSVIRRRANVPALLSEFAETLWQELDYAAEADHAEEFKRLFTDDRRVYVPSVFRNHSTGRVLTLEDVTSIKITDTIAIETAGIDRSGAAKELLDIYLKMIFDFGLFHADPHPGNLFLYPLPADASQAMYGSAHPYPGKPFYIVFVDFGMVGRITDEVKAGLREALIAIAMRDAARILAAYEMLGVLLPSADSGRIAAAQQEMMNVAWGRSVPELAQMPRSEMRQFAAKYRDLLYDMPFQVPQNFIYLARAVGILSGICSGLDPNFNPWQPLAEYAQRYMTRNTSSNVQTVAREAAKIGQTAISLPNQIQDVLTQVQRGDLTVRLSPDDDLHRQLRRIEVAVRSVSGALVFGSILMSATLLFIGGKVIPGVVGYVLAALSWMILVFRGSRLR